MVKVKIVTSLLTENTHSSTQETVHQYRDEPQVNRVKLLVHVVLTVATFSFDFIFYAEYSIWRWQALSGHRNRKITEEAKVLRILFTRDGIARYNSKVSEWHMMYISQQKRNTGAGEMPKE